MATAVVGAAALAPWWMIAQQTSGDPNLTIGALVLQLGLSAVFLWQWIRADKERRETAAQYVDLIEKFGPALIAASDALDRVLAGMAVQVERATPERRELERLERTTDDLAELVRKFGETPSRSNRRYRSDDPHA